MSENELILNVIKNTTNGDLKWEKTIKSDGIYYKTNSNIHGNKKILIILCSKNKLDESFMDISMSNGIKIANMNILVFRKLYKLINLLNYYI